MANLTITVNTCAVCDANVDPMSVPSTSCGHSPDQCRPVVVPVVSVAPLREWIEERRHVVPRQPPVCLGYRLALHDLSALLDDLEGDSNAD